MSRLEVVQLTKRYPKVVAVDELAFEVGPGELVGLIGPNGAGKTTTFRIIVGLLLPDAGEVRIDGRSITQDPVWAKRQVGYVPQRVVLYDYLTAEEYLHFIADVRSIEAKARQERTENLFQLLDLHSHRDRLIRELSGGMRRKLAIAAALLARPPFLLFDESFVGLDPESTYRLQGYLLDYVKDGGSLILSSHILDMMERFVTRIILMHRGKVVREVTEDELRQIARSEGSSLTKLYLKETGNEHLIDGRAAGPGPENDGAASKGK